MDDILAFIHIKKTGGISLQKMLAKQYGKKFFGGHTHSALRKMAVNPLGKDELHGLPKGSCVCKHWTYSDYKPIHDRAEFVTIVRDPVDRISSHYNFYLKHYPMGQSFYEYIHDPMNINIYSRFLPADPALLSEIYLFHKLQDSVNHSKIICRCKIPHTNKTPYQYKISDDEIALFRVLNQKDLELYEEYTKNAI